MLFLQKKGFKYWSIPICTAKYCIRFWGVQYDIHNIILVQYRQQHCWYFPVIFDIAETKCYILPILISKTMSWYQYWSENLNHTPNDISNYLNLFKEKKFILCNSRIGLNYGLHNFESQEFNHCPAGYHFK